MLDERNLLHSQLQSSSLLAEMDMKAIFFTPAGDITLAEMDMKAMKDKKGFAKGDLEKTDEGDFASNDKEFYEPRNVNFTSAELDHIKKLRDSGSMKMILNPMPYEFKDALLNRSVRTRNGNPIHLYGVDASGQVHKHHHGRQHHLHGAAARRAMSEQPGMTSVEKNKLLARADLSRYHKNFHKSRLDNTVYLTNSQIEKYGLKGQVVDLEKYHAERIRRMHEKSEKYHESKIAFNKAEQGIIWENVAEAGGGQDTPAGEKAVEDGMHERINSRIERNVQTIGMVPPYGAGRGINKGRKFNTLIENERVAGINQKAKADARARKFNVVHQSEYRFNQDLKIDDNSFASNNKNSNKRMLNVQREDAMLIPHDTRVKKNINTVNNFHSGGACMVDVDKSLLHPSQLGVRQRPLETEPQFYRKV